MSLKLTNTLLFSTLLTIGTVHAAETSSLELKVKRPSHWEHVLLRLWMVILLPTPSLWEM